MNKTTSINLGGLFFHIDEDAYNKLNRYFEAVKKSLSPDGRDEIIKDIENRVAELFNQKLSNSKQVIGNIEVDEVIAIMGQPQDYKIEDDSESKNETFDDKTIYQEFTTRKLYRDRDNAKVGGVLAGLSHYLGVDVIWLRLILLAMVLFFGTGVLLYIILWIIIPEAMTTSQKLEMKGQPINISNIERKVKENIDTFADSINDFGKKNFSNVGSNNSLGDFITTLARAFVKIIGIFFLFIAVLSLIGLVIASVALMFSSLLPKATTFGNIETIFGYDIPFWLQGILILFTFGIPLITLIYFGIRAIFGKLKPMSNNLRYILITTWVLSLITSIFCGINFVNEFANEGKIMKRERLNSKSGDTLKIKFVNNELFSKDNYNHDMKIVQDSLKNEVIYSNDITLYLKQTDKKFAYLVIEKTSKGSSFQQADEKAEQIQYNFKILGNTLVFDNYFLTDIKNKFRAQEVEIYLYLPEGVYYQQFDSAKRYIDNGDFEYFDNIGNPIYHIKNGEMNCVDCEDSDDNEVTSEDDDEDVSIKINGKEFFKTETKENDSIEKIKIDINGNEFISAENKKKPNK